MGGWLAFLLVLPVPLLEAEREREVKSLPVSLLEVRTSQVCLWLIQLHHWRPVLCRRCLECQAWSSWIYTHLHPSSFLCWQLPLPLPGVINTHGFRTSTYLVTPEAAPGIPSSQSPCSFICSWHYHPSCTSIPSTSSCFCAFAPILIVFQKLFSPSLEDSDFRLPQAYLA